MAQPTLDLSQDDWHEIEREACRRSLSTFTRRAWPIIEPGNAYVHGWHVDAISEHLQAVAHGEINRLLINVPPGTMKSTLVAVMFPAWLWGPAGLSHQRIIGASYESSLATRDSRRMKMVVESDWFQDLWPIRIMQDESRKTSFENSARGFRQAVPVSSITGKRGDVVIWDDPLNPRRADSPVERESAIRVLRETLPNRLVNPDTSSIVIVMQRLHERDPSGFLIENDFGYEHLMLPMEFEPQRKCCTSIGWEDPRTEDGELLFEERFPREVVERDKAIMGSYATAGQYQQRPAPRGGGMFKRADFEIIPARPNGGRWVRGWDLAASTDKDSAWTAGALMGKLEDGSFVIADMQRDHQSPAGVERLIRNTATQDGADTSGSLPQDPGAGGKAWARALIAAVAGFNYRASPETGDKVTRAQAFAAQVEVGNVRLVKGGWNEAFLSEAEVFPHGKFLDQIDACSRAFMELTSDFEFEWYFDGKTYT